MLTTVIGLGVAGLLLLFLEMFLPGMIAGIAGGILLISAVATSYSTLGNAAGNATLLAAVVCTGALWWWWSTQFQKTRFGRMMTLETAVTGTTHAEHASLAGLQGTAVTPLRPGGTVMVNGRRVDAVTSGEFLESGSAVEIVRTHGMGVLVRAVEAAPTSNAA